MKRFSLIFLAFAVFLGLVLSLSNAYQQAAEGAAAPRVADAEQIGRWIVQLGDDDFDVREAASRGLLGREEAVPALRQALKSPDAEMHKRAADLLEARDRKRAPHELDKARKLAEDGRIDEAVERLVRWQGSDESKKGWEAVYQLAIRAAEAADHDIKPDSVDCRPEILKYFPPRSSYRNLVGTQPTEYVNPSKTITRCHHSLIQGEAIELGGRADCRGSIFAASRSTRLLSVETLGVIVVSGGPVEVGRINSSIIICDGDFITHSGVINCVVIARGEVTCGPMTGGVFISASEVKLAPGNREKCIVHTGDAVPLGFIKFFDPAEAGVEASAVDDHGGGTGPDGVLVKGVAKGKPFAAAGLRAGDVITAVGEEKLTPSEKAADQFDSFRRALRKALAADEAFTLSVRRSDKVLELTVRPAD